MRRLLEMVEKGLTPPKDTMSAERLAQHRQNIAQLDVADLSLPLQLARDSCRIDADILGHRNLRPLPRRSLM